MEEKVEATYIYNPDTNEVFYVFDGQQKKYQDIQLADIINWCKANNQVAWLKETAEKEYPVKDKETGEVVGTRKITYIELKLAFVREFMSFIAPKEKEKKPSMYDLIASL
jgi:hypothetical protein